MNIANQIKLFFVPGILLAAILAIMQQLGGDILAYGIWYDKIMHLLGGAGACVLACLTIVNLPRRWRILFFVAGLPIVGRVSALFVGGLWEWAEAAFPVMTNYVEQGMWDTFFDLCFDYIGGHVAGEIYNRILKKFPEVGCGRLLFLPEYYSNSNPIYPQPDVDLIPSGYIYSHWCYLSGESPSQQ